MRRRNEDELSAEERFVELTLYFLNKVNFKGGRKEEGEEEGRFIFFGFVLGNGWRSSLFRYPFFISM